MRLFSRKNAPVLGIDISTSAIKLLELSKTSDHYKIESYAVTPLPLDTIVERNIADIDGISGAIKEAVKKSGTRITGACVGVSGSVVMTKIISLPVNLNDEDREEQLLFEVNKFVPYPLDEVSFDYEVQEVTEGNPELNNVLLVATRRENVDARIEALNGAGLETKIVDVEAFAIENSFALLASHIANRVDDQIIAMVDIGASTTTLNVLSGGVTIYTREQDFGGRQLTGEIQRRYGLSYEQAGLSKRLGGLPDNYLADVLNPFKKAVVQQVTRSLQFFLSSNVGKNIDGIVLAGGCASIQELDVLVAASLGVPTLVANPFMDMTLSKKIRPQSLSNDAPAMMVACGLALRGFS